MPAASRPRRPRAILFAALAIVFMAAVAAIVAAGTALAGVEISGHGMLAIGLGAALSLALSVGLFALVFYSARHGHDEAAHRRNPLL